MKFKFTVKSDAPKLDSEKVELDRYFLLSLAKEMVRIVKLEIKQELFGNASQDVKDLIRSWKYDVSGDEIKIWSDHKSLTDKEPVEEEPTPDDEKVVDLKVRNLTTRIVIHDDGELEVREVKAKTNAQDEWVFPSHLKSAFLERSNKKIMNLIHTRIVNRSRKLFSNA